MSDNMNRNKKVDLNRFEERILIGLAELAESFETAALVARRTISEIVQVEADPPWAPEQIKWTTATGPSGPYERSDDVDSPAFKAMFKDLTANQGKLHRDGFFFWLFRNGNKVGRKPLKKQELQQ